MKLFLLLSQSLAMVLAAASSSGAALADSEWRPEIISQAELAGDAKLMSHRGGSPTKEKLRQALDSLKLFVESKSPHREKFYYFYAKALNLAGMEKDAILWAERSLKTPYNHLEAAAQLPDADYLERLLKWFPRYLVHNNPLISGAHAIYDETVKRYLVFKGAQLRAEDIAVLSPPKFVTDQLDGTWRRHELKLKTLIEIADLYRSMGDAQNAVYYYEWAMLQQPIVRGSADSREFEWEERPYWEIGRTYEESGNWDQALNAYLKHIAFLGTRYGPQHTGAGGREAIAKVKEMCARLGAGEKQNAPKIKRDKDTLLAIAKLWRGDHHYVFAYEIYDQIEKEFKVDIHAERAATLEEEADFLAFVTSRGCFRLNGELLTRARIERAYNEALKAYEKLGKAEEKKKVYAEKLKGLTELIDYVPVDIDLLPQNPRPKD